jgi:hypothetical protein
MTDPTHEDAVERRVRVARRVHCNLTVGNHRTGVPHFDIRIKTMKPFISDLVSSASFRQGALSTRVSSV